MHELFRSLAVLAEPPSEATALVARALGIDAPLEAPAYTELFTLSLYPYASVYLSEDGMMGGDTGDRIAGFWRALGLPPPPEPDHLASLLGAYASLDELVAAGGGAPERAALEHARRALLFEHLLSWLPPYLVKIEEIGTAAYVAWARTLRDALKDAAHAAPVPQIAPLHLRWIPGLADPRTEGATAFIASLLAPARSGMIFTRADLARAARELGLGLRRGERRFVLAALFGQEPRATLAWLSEEAARWSERHRGIPFPGPARRHWIAQADESRALLADLGGSLSEWRASGT